MKVYYLQKDHGGLKAGTALNMASERYSPCIPHNEIHEVPFVLAGARDTATVYVLKRNEGIFDTVHPLCPSRVGPYALGAITATVDRVADGLVLIHKTVEMPFMNIVIVVDDRLFSIDDENGPYFYDPDARRIANRVMMAIEKENIILAADDDIESEVLRIVYNAMYTYRDNM